MRTQVHPFAAAVAGAAFAVAGLAWCGGTPTSSADSPDASSSSCSCPAPVVRSGTRLRARVLRSEDGASQFLGWYDSQLGTPCARVSSAGSPFDGRCAPSPTLNPDGTHFADTSCHVPLGMMIAGNAGATFCADGKGAVRAGAAVSKVYKRDDQGACIEADDAFTKTPGATFYACDGETVAPEAFTRMEEARD